MLANVVGDDHADGEAARHRLGDEVDVAMPDLADVETAAVLRRRWLAGALSEPRFEEAITLLVSMPISRFAAAPFLPRAFELRGAVAAYDAMYVAHAEALGCPLVTGDGRLARDFAVASRFSPSAKAPTVGHGGPTRPDITGPAT